MSCHLSSIFFTKNSTFQHSSSYELHFIYKFIYVFVLQFYNPNLVVQFMYIKSAFDQQIEQVSTFCISNLKTISDLPCSCTYCHRQLPTPPTLKNHLPFIVQLRNHSLLIVIIVIDHRLIVLKLEYFSSFIHNYSHSYHSLTNRVRHG